MSKLIGVYSIKNMVNGKMIIGSARDISKRWSNYMSKLNNSVFSNDLLQDEWIAYGESQFEFEILELVDNVEDLFPKEKEWLDRYWESGILYNKNRIRNTVKKIRDPIEAAEHKKFMSEKFSGTLNPNCKLTEDDVETIKSMLDDGVGQSKIARQFGVSPQQIHKIKNSERWCNV